MYRRLCPGYTDWRMTLWVLPRVSRDLKAAMQDASFLAETLIFLFTAVAVAPIFQRLRSSLMPGHLVAGVIIGPAVFDLISDSMQVHKLAALGVVFLLFTIVLELNVDRLILTRDWIFGVGTAKVVVTSATTGLRTESCFPMSPCRRS